jgi:WD40 repeat protein
MAALFSSAAKYALRLLVLAGVMFVLPAGGNRAASHPSFPTTLNRVLAQNLSSQIAISGKLYTLAWSSDNVLLATGGDDGIDIYSTTLQPVAYLPSQTKSFVWRLAWSPDNHYLASVNWQDSSVQIWLHNQSNDQFTLERTITNALGFENVMGLSWSPDGNHLALVDEAIPQGFAGSVGAIEIWDTNTWTLERTFDGLIRSGSKDIIKFPVNFLTWSPDSTRLASAANVCVPNEVVSCIDPYFYIVDVTQGQTVYVSNIVLETIFSMTWSANNQLAIGEQSTTYLFDTENLQFISQFRNYSQNLTGAYNLYWLPNNTDLVSVSFSENAVFVTNVATKALRLQFPVNDFNVTSLSPDGARLAVTHQEGHRLQIWELTNFVDVSGTPTLTPLPTLAFTPTPTHTD